MEYTILQGKHTVGTVFLGALISLSEKGMQLQSPHSLQLLSNIKLKLLIEPKLAIEEEYIYAKVIQESYVDGHLFLLRFTVVPPKMIAILNALRQSG